MAARTPPPSSNPVYSYGSYPAEYGYPPCACPGSPAAMPSMPLHRDQPYSPQCAHPHYLPHLGHPAAPPSPRLGHAHLPPSPVIHGTHSPPTSPDRHSSSSERAELKVVRQLCSAITKMQGTMKDLAERQEQILDRMSLLEQRVGRMDDGIEKLLESTEVAVEDSKVIRTRVEDSERSIPFSQDAFESRLTELMDDAVNKLMGNIGNELKDIRKTVNETQKYVKYDPFSWTNRMAMAQRITDAAVLGEEPQKEVAI